MVSVRLVQAAVLATVLASGFQAQANKVIARSKDWVLTDYSTAQQPNGTCVASTSERLRKNTVRIEVYGKKGSRQVLEVIVRETGADFGHTGIILSTKDASFRIAAAPMSKDAQSQFHWVVPQNTTHLLNVMNANAEMKAVSIGGTQPLDFKFSTRGLAKIIQEMQRLCTNGAVVNSAFEQLFLSGAQQPVDPARLDSATVQSLRSMYHQGHQIFLQKLDNQGQMEKLRQQYAAEINEMHSLNALIQKLEQQDIPRLLNQINDTEATRISSEADLARTRAAIPGLAQAEQRADAHKNAMEAIVAPLRGEHNTRASALSAARQDLSDSQSRLSTVRNELSRLNREIINLRGEAQSIDQRIVRTRNEVVYARTAHASAERDLRTFDRESEVRIRLARETSYDRDVREARDKRTDVMSLDRELDRAESDLRQKQQALTTCQATAGADCTSQQAAVTTAQGARDQVRSRRDTARRTLEMIESRIRSTEERVRREVNREYDILADRERAARAKLNDLELSIARDQQRYNHIVQFEIPTRDSEIRRLDSEESTLVRNIPYIESRVATLQAELADFRRRTDWDRKKQNLDDARADHSAKAQAHASALAHEGNLVRTIEHCKVEKPRLESVLANTRQQLANTKARHVVVEKALEPFHAENNRLSNIDATHAAGLGSMARDFESKLPR